MNGLTYARAREGFRRGLRGPKQRRAARLHAAAKALLVLSGPNNCPFRKRAYRAAWKKARVVAITGFTVIAAALVKVVRNGRPRA